MLVSLKSLFNNGRNKNSLSPLRGERAGVRGAAADLTLIKRT
jgi:hypothetical protein